MEEETANLQLFFILMSCAQHLPLFYIAITLTIVYLRKDIRGQRIIRLESAELIKLVRTSWAIFFIDVGITVLVYLKTAYQSEMPFLGDAINFLIRDLSPPMYKLDVKEDSWTAMTLWMGLSHMTPLIMMIGIIFVFVMGKLGYDSPMLNTNPVPPKGNDKSWDMRTLDIEEIRLIRLESSERIMIIAIIEAGTAVFSENKEEDTGTQCFYFERGDVTGHAMTSNEITVSELETLFPNENE